MLALKIVACCDKNKYELSRNPQEYNIIYVEGMNADGTLNNDAPNQFNDLRMILGFESDDDPVILGLWDATTEPGKHYTYKPMNPKGAARIAFGQYKAWRVGQHGNAEPHEALIQCGKIKVHRDYNKDFVRTGDAIDEGLFGINQHYGYDLPKTDIGLASAGCLVGRTRNGHREFMRLLKCDRRYQKDKNFIFTTTIIAGDKLC